MERTAGTPELPTQEKPVNRNVYRWNRLTDTDPAHGLMDEVWNLRGFAQMLHSHFDPEKSYLLEAGGLFNITRLLDHLVEDLEKGIERVVALNVAEIERGERETV